MITGRDLKVRGVRWTGPLLDTQTAGGREPSPTAGTTQDWPEVHVLVKKLSPVQATPESFCQSGFYVTVFSRKPLFRG